LELKPAVPAFRFVYFDPKDKTYKTLTTEPIPLQMSPAMPPKADTLAPPQALMEPVERMTDILGTLHPADLTISNDSLLSGWTGHLIAALIALGLIGKALWMRNAHKFRKDPVREQRIRELREIEGMRNADDSGFLMSAGRFIERWLGANPSPEVRAVLAERDAVCFRQDLPNSTKLDPKRRDSILRVLRKAAMLWMAAALLETGTARADDLATQAQAAYDTAKYDVAIGLWLKAGSYEKLSPDTLFNIGNACYRAGSPGHAALYYRRALARDPSHQESRQNLRFIERKHGSITVHRPEYQYAIAKLSLSTWQGMLWTGAWICTLAALVFPATRPGARIRMPAVAALVAGPLLAACGGLGWWYFPNDAEFAAVERQAVIIGEKAILHSDAARTSPEVIDAPPGSLCEVIRESGRWAYVAFATKTRGWVPMENVEKVIPTTPPVPPTIRKPKADGKSA
jgi:tetratricopeptide (TPR) repeat protein